MRMSTATSVPVPRDPSRHELAADCIIHILGFGAASIGGATLVALIAARGDWLELGALLIYAVGMVAMFGCSAAYNLARTSRWRAAFQRCDHAAIFVMIAGTYTPFTLLRLDGAWSWGLTTAVWSIAGVGVLDQAVPGLRPALRLGGALPAARLDRHHRHRPAIPVAGMGDAGADRPGRRALHDRHRVPRLGRGCRSRTRSGTRSCSRRHRFTMPPSFTAW